MSLRKQSGNMYEFISHTWNPIKGICRHKCVYCYMLGFKLKPIRPVEKELKTRLGKDNFIFVGSSTDMWAEDVPDLWIEKVLRKCREFPENRYLFQSKNPERFSGFSYTLPENVVLGTTIESNYDVFMRNGKQWQASKAPKPSERYEAMTKLKGITTMVTIEPIMKFDCDTLVSWIKHIAPEWVNIGADSKGHNLPEPSWKEVEELIAKLQAVTEVKLKSNLGRIRNKEA